MTDTCERCLQPFPGDHEQVIDHTFSWEAVVREAFVGWICPFVKEEA